MHFKEKICKINTVSQATELIFISMTISLQQNLKIGQSNRNIDDELKRQNEIEKKLGCKFIRIYPAERNFNIFKAINKIQRRFKESSKKSLIYRISKRSLEVEYKSNHSINSRVLKYAVSTIWLPQ